MSIYSEIINEYGFDPEVDWHASYDWEPWGYLVEILGASGWCAPGPTDAAVWYVEVDPDTQVITGLTIREGGGMLEAR